MYETMFIKLNRIMVVTKYMCQRNRTATCNALGSILGGFIGREKVIIWLFLTKQPVLQQIPSVSCVGGQVICNASTTIDGIL